MNRQYTYQNANGAEQERVRTHAYARGVAGCRTVDGGIIMPDAPYLLEDGNQTDVHEEQIDVLYAGPMSDNWGFFFVESLSRLWPMLKGDVKCKIAIPAHVAEGNIWGGHTKRMLELMGWLCIKEENLYLVTKPTRFKRMIVPEVSFVHLEIPTYGHKTPLAYAERVGDNDDFYFAEQYATIYDAIATNCDVEVPKYEKIYLSRTRLKQNKEIGELYFEDCFRRAGFAIVYPEQLSISEQIAYMKHCKVLASIEGTLAHNVLFTTQCERQIILRKQSEIIPRQSMLNQAKRVPIQYIDVYYEPLKRFPLSHSKGPFWVKANEQWMTFMQDEGWDEVLPKRSYTMRCALRYVYRCTIAYVEYIIKKIIRR